MPVKPIFDSEYLTSLLKAYVKSQESKDEHLAKTMPEVLERITNEVVGEDSDSDVLYSEEKKLISDTVDTAISQKGNLNTPYNQQRISKVPKQVAEYVKYATDGEIEISEKYIAINGPDIWHEYKSHRSMALEQARHQLTNSSADIKEAIYAIYTPDVVEGLLTRSENVTQRQSFVYAKKSPNGYYIVVEAVGGKRNPNIVPVMILQFDESKLENAMKNGKVLGELLFENDTKKLSELDISAIKKNRVTVAQFASKEAIANTPRSPQFDNIVSQKNDSVKTYEENLSEQDSDKLTNRVLLANALESVAQNDIEKKRLEEYKDKLNTIYEAEKQLADIRKEANALRFKKGRTAAETQKLKSLDEEAGKIANRA